MATVLEACTAEEQRYVVRFCGQKDSMQWIFIKKCFLFTGGRCLSRKAIRNLVSQGRSKVADDETDVRKWLRQQAKDFYAAGFDALVEDMSRNKCFSRV
jgi:chloramphenicol 3-O-phosphotransferase